MTKILSWIKDIQPIDTDVKIFEDYYSKTVGIPLGTERLHWNIEALKKEEKKLTQLNDLYKDKILEKCFELIEKYGK